MVTKPNATAIGWEDGVEQCRENEQRKPLTDQQSRDSASDLINALGLDRAKRLLCGTTTPRDAEWAAACHEYNLGFAGGWDAQLAEGR